jgi:DNA adenine methylase
MSTQAAKLSHPARTKAVERPKPFVKWVGGKRKLVPMLLQMIPEFGKYHEPFVGGGALFFGLAESDVTECWANISDQNERLIRSYRAIRDDLDTVLSRLETLAKGHCKDLYYEIRDQEIDQAQTDAEVAAWFIYLNRTGFNGLYRVNRSGRFNVPLGSYENPNICDEKNLGLVSRVLQGAEIRHESFESVFDRADEGDLVYFDPPYVPRSPTSSFTSYTAKGFNLPEQERLRDIARALKLRGINVLLSNSDTPIVRKLYAQGFEMQQVFMGRAINSKASGRGAVPELVIW